MLQKRLCEQKSSLDEIQHAGEFFLRHDESLAGSLLDSQSVQFQDLLDVCMTWFRRPPKPLKDIALANTHGPPKKLFARAPSIDGVW
jgi:hypothetical protein